MRRVWKVKQERQTANCLLSQSPFRSTMKSVALPLAFCDLHFAISQRRHRLMCHKAFAVILAAVFAFCPMVSVQAAEKSREPLVERVHKAIEAGVRFLRDQEKGNGNWEVDQASVSRRGGWTGLAMLALLN